MLVIISITVFSSFILYLLINSLLSLIKHYRRHIGYKIALFAALNISNYFIIKRKGKIYDLVYSAFISYIHNVRDTRFVIQAKLTFIKMRWWTVLIFFLLCLISLIYAGYLMIESTKEDGFGDTTELFVSSFFILSFILGLICTHKTSIIIILLCLMIIPIIIKLKKYGISSYSGAFQIGWIFFDIFFLWVYLYPNSLVMNSLYCSAYLLGLIIGALIKGIFGGSGGGYSFNDSEEPESIYDKAMRKTGNMIEDDFGRKGYITGDYVEDEYGFKTHKIEENNYLYIKDSDGHYYHKRH